MHVTARLHTLHCACPGRLYVALSLAACSGPLPLLQGLGLVFVAVYQKALKLLYVDELLERVNK